MRFTALSVAAAMILAAFAGCRDDAEPPEEEKTEAPAPERPPKRQDPSPKRPRPPKQIHPRKKPALPAADAPSAPDKRSGGGKEKGKNKGGKDGGKEKGKGKSGGQGGHGNGGGGNGHGGHGGSYGGGNGNGGQGDGNGGQGGYGGNGKGGGRRNGGRGGRGDRLPKGWEDNQVSVPPADSEKQIWDMMVGELAKLAAGPAEFAPLGSSQSSRKRSKEKYHAIGRCTITDDSGSRSGYTFSCEFGCNGYEAVILRVEFSPAGGD